MPSHKDRHRAPGLSPQGKANHETIFGPAKGAGVRTPEEEEEYEASRRHHHAKLAEDGRKDPQWYLDNERRIPQDASYVKKPVTSKAYRDGWDRIFGGDK